MDDADRPVGEAEAERAGLVEAIERPSVPPLDKGVHEWRGEVELLPALTHSVVPLDALMALEADDVVWFE